MLTETLRKIEAAIFTKNAQHIKNIVEDKECAEYCGLHFQIGELHVKFRRAKITPKKIGQFVTLWKRNAQGETEPFHAHDNYDFYIIATESEDRFGFFLFPKAVLAEKQILTASKEGKRGFRVYPDWSVPENKQAIRTQEWQAAFFIDLTDGDNPNTDKIRLILSK
jgi:hypothetical protein